MNEKVRLLRFQNSAVDGSPTHGRRFRACQSPGPQIVRGVTDEEYGAGVIREVQRVERFEDRLGMGLGLIDLIAKDYVLDVVVKATHLDGPSADAMTLTRDNADTSPSLT